MYGGFLWLHSLIRWALLLLLVVNLIRLNVESKYKFDRTDKRWSQLLYYIVFANLVASIYLYFYGDNGLQVVEIQKYTLQDVLQSDSLRFWIIEHPLMMLFSLLLIMASHFVAIKDRITPTQKHTALSVLYITALVVILVAVPWPFRGEGIARPAFRALNHE